MKTFDQLESAAKPGATFLFHPTMLEYYEVADEFEGWIEADLSVSEQLAADGEGISVVLDCLIPLWIR